MAIMGTGVASGEHRARTAATAAISSPLLEDVSVHGARGVIINVTGGPDLTLAEVSEASEIVNSAAHEDANIIFGAAVDPAMEGRIKITVIATGFDREKAAVAPAAQASKPTPVDMSVYTMAKPVEERVPVNGGRVVVSRRPILDLPGLRASGPAAATAAATLTDPDTEDPSPLDVPAFMRRSD